MRIAWLVVVVVLGLATPATADIDNAKADALFTEGVALRDKDPEAACKKFAEALGYNPQAISTRLNVALCDERMGRIASAVDKFIEVADRARENKLGEFQRVAEEKIKLLSPDVPHVTFKLAEPRAPEQKLLVDNEVIPLDKLVDRPIDPGKRVLVVTAPGRVPYTRTLDIARRDRRTIDIPVLVAAKNARATIGKIAVIAGGATAATGLVLGLVAVRRYNSARDDHCGFTSPSGVQQCDSDGLSAIDSARTLGNVATVVTILGVAGAAVGGYLWWRAPAGERKSVAVGVAPRTDGGVVFAAGRF